MSINPLRLLKILDRYLAKEFFTAFFAVLGVACCLMLINTFFSEFKLLAEYRPPISVAALYLFYKLPQDVVELAPILSLLATLFSIGMLAKNNEVLAMHACGISYTRLGIPVFLCGLTLIVITYLGAEFLIPAFTQQAVSLKYRIEGETLKGSETDQFKPETGNIQYWMELFDPVHKVMAYPVIFTLNESGGGVSKKLVATSGRYIEPDPEEDLDIWLFEEAIFYTYEQDDSGYVGQPVASPSLKVKLPRHLDLLLSRPKKQAEMNIADLGRTIGILKSFGVKTFVQSTDFFHKIAFPVSALLFAMIGYTISVRAHVRPMVVGFTYGMAFSLSYYLIDALSINLGHEGHIPAFFGGWTANIAISLAACYRIYYINSVKN